MAAAPGGKVACDDDDDDDTDNVDDNVDDDDEMFREDIDELTTRYPACTGIIHDGSGSGGKNGFDSNNCGGCSYVHIGNDNCP